MATKEMTKQESQVPDLVRTPALEITAEDVALPRVYIGQFMSQPVQDKLVGAGDIYTALGAEDGDPNVLWEYDDSPGEKDGVVFHVIGLRKGRSASVDGELMLYDYNDPEAPPDSWVTYNYFVALPEHDPDVPYKWLFTRTGTPAAKQINMVLKKAEGAGPAWSVAFQAVSKERSNAKGKFFIPRVRQVKAKKAHVETAERLAVLIAGTGPDLRATGEEPAI